MFHDSRSHIVILSKAHWAVDQIQITFGRRPRLGRSQVLSWPLSNTLTTDFCLEAVQEAITQYGTPAIFNTDQVCQFTSLEFTGLLKA